MMDLVVIEHANQRVLTTQQLAKAYGTDDKKIRDNFTNNRHRYIPGKHYFKVEGEELQKLKNDTESFGVVGDRASSVYLWTEKGAWMHAKSLNTDEAWNAFEMLVDEYYRIHDAIQTNISNLSPQLQLLINLELQQKRLEQEIAVTREEVEDIREVISININKDWREMTNKILQKIGYKFNNYKEVKESVYRALESRARCQLEIRLNNLRARALVNGMAPSKVKALNYLDVIAEDKRLIEIYIAIVKELAVKNGVKPDDITA